VLGVLGSIFWPEEVRARRGTEKGAQSLPQRGDLEKRLRLLCTEEGGRKVELKGVGRGEAPSRWNTSPNGTPEKGYCIIVFSQIGKSLRRQADPGRTLSGRLWTKKQPVNTRTKENGGFQEPGENPSKSRRTLQTTENGLMEGPVLAFNFRRKTNCPGPRSGHKENGSRTRKQGSPRTGAGRTLRKPLRPSRERRKYSEKLRMANSIAMWTGPYAREGVICVIVSGLGLKRDQVKLEGGSGKVAVVFSKKKGSSRGGH